MATGQNIADEARADLNDGDASNYRWSDAEMLRFVNASLRQIVLILPEANVIEEEFDLVIGSRQLIPTGGTKFLGAYNFVLVGEDFYRGRAITEVEEDALNSSFPDWSYVPAAPAEVDWVGHHYTHDPRDPTAFALYPTVPDENQTILIKYALVPTALATLASTFPLRDEYINASVEYTKYRMLSKDGRYGSEPAVRAELWNNFLRLLGVKVAADKRVDPATTRPPADEHG